MPHFDIVKTNAPKNTFRVSKIQSDFDIKPDHSCERFIGDIEIPNGWNIGVIYGSSGSGKTTIARHLWGEGAYVTGFSYMADSVIDDMPCADVDEIARMFYSVGFGAVPSWLKPYRVLSNGEKMRVDLARALLTNDLVVFDEFTSVVDRQVAQTMCIATEKAVRRQGKQFIAVTCHRDVLEWLQPDWIFNTDVMRNFHHPSGRLKASKSEDATARNGRNLDVITI